MHSSQPALSPNIKSTNFIVDDSSVSISYVNDKFTCILHRGSFLNWYFLNRIEEIVAAYHHEMYHWVQQQLSH